MNISSFIVILKKMIKSVFISILLFFQVFCINFSFADALDDVFSNSTQNQILTSKSDVSDNKVKDYITNTTQTMLKIAIII